MTLRNLIIFTLFFTTQFCYAQFESIKPYHSVYNYLLKKQTEGELPMSSSFYLPQNRNVVYSKLNNMRSYTNRTDSSRSVLFQNHFDNFVNETNYTSKGFQKDLFGDYLFDDKNSYLFYYKDSILQIEANPIFSYKFVTQTGDSIRRNTSLTSFGGHLSIFYSDWLTLYLSAWNGIQSGDRKLATVDERIRHNFTHQIGGLENFDGTEGYVSIEKEFFSFKFGRERLMWGNSNLNRIGFDSTSQIFDFVTFSLNYGSFDYRFLHGWLVEIPDSSLNEETGVKSTFKNPKFIAYSRLRFAPNEDISIGASQTMIYSNRPFEAAYLNPFILWESAQRSLNDLDNSYWTFDMNWRITNGLVWNGTIMFDDINFNYLLKGDWSTSSNSAVYQTGLRLAYPFMIKNSLLDIEYTIVRPYAFSHYGLERPLSYTNNGYQLGLGIPPNSTVVSLSFDYDVTYRININVRADYIKHGNNIYDEDGNLVLNVGGDVFKSKTLITPYYSFLLDGILEKQLRVINTLTYLFSNHITFQLVYNYNSVSFEGKYRATNTFMLGLNFY
jgi:hypothetical protein